MKKLETNRQDWKYVVDCRRNYPIEEEVNLKKKLLITLAVGALMLTSAAAGAYGATNLQTIKANLNLGLKFKVDGKDWAAKDQSGKQIYAITYNGTTYLPIRSAGSALGVEVGWDGANNTVWLGEGAAAVEAGEKPVAAAGSSRSNAAPLKTKVSVGVEDILDNYKAEVTVNEVKRGVEAEQLVKEANSFNDAAPEGFEYLIANITFKVVSNAKEDAKVDISPVDFTAVSSAGKDYDYTMAVDPEPSLSTSLYEGASHTGWATFLVQVDDKNPLLSFGRKYDGTGGIWFKLQ